LIFGAGQGLFSVSLSKEGINMKNVNFGFVRAAGAVLCAAIVITAFAACENLVDGEK
jgi:hypothetical protein